VRGYKTENESNVSAVALMSDVCVCVCVCARALFFAFILGYINLGRPEKHRP
jgi:hypothetical protein